MAEKIYPYAVARIRVLEQRLLTKQAFSQMAEARTPDEALRMLKDAGYDTGEIENAYEYEKVLAAELSKTYALVQELAPDENFLDIFLYKVDYHNLKVLIKEELSGLDGEKYLLQGGTIPVDTLKKAIEDKDTSILPEEMANAVENAYESFHSMQSGQAVDVALDKGVFASMEKMAKASKQGFLMEYVALIADLTNLKSYMRIKKMKKTFEFFRMVYVPGGSLTLDFFQKVFKAENPSAELKGIRYSGLAEGMEKGFTEFEKLCDNYVTEFTRKAKYISLTVEPLIAYVYAKETEIKTVRIIMSSKINKIDAETIKERLRDAYV